MAVALVGGICAPLGTLSSIGHVLPLHIIMAGYYVSVSLSIVSVSANSFPCDL